MHSAQQNKMGWYIGGMAATVVTLTGGKDPLRSARGSCSKAAPAAPAASWRTTNTAADRLARSAGTSRGTTVILASEIQFRSPEQPRRSDDGEMEGLWQCRPLTRWNRSTTPRGSC
ncbi:hypothetical protein GCM10009577_65240 [Streptomyces javensis]